MKKTYQKIKKNSQNHQIEATSISHYEIAQEFYHPFIDPDSTLAESYLAHLKNELDKK